MKRLPSQPPTHATGQPNAAADRERLEPASPRRDRWSIAALRPTVYCPRQRLPQCLLETHEHP
jgi:hypothetical protein